MKLLLAFLLMTSCAHGPIAKESDAIIHPAPDMDAGLVLSDKPEVAPKVVAPVPTLLPAAPEEMKDAGAIPLQPQPKKAVVKKKTKKGK